MVLFPCHFKPKQTRSFHIKENKLSVILFPAAGLQNGLRLQAPHCPWEAEAQERGGDPRHCHGIYVRGGWRQCRHTAAIQVPAAATAEGEDTLAQLAQQLHQGQRGGQRWALQQPVNHGEQCVCVCQWKMGI